MISFIPNDPLAISDMPARRTRARPDRPAGRAGFRVIGQAPEKIYPVGEPGFVQWQARQAAILALEAWERVAGEPLTSWAAEAANPLLLVPDLKEELNAYYTRQGVEFCHKFRDGETAYFGTSADVVAHEVGHGVLDALRPEFWDSNYMEVNAFHEAFGDITAIVTALGDTRTRKRLLEVTPDLTAANFVEAVQEYLHDSIRRVEGDASSGSQPRHARNTFTWQLPETFRDDGPPDVMINEVHSIARIITGCFYDLIVLIASESGAPTPATLLAATRVAGKLLYRAAKSAPEVPRFFAALGTAMVLDDEALHDGRHGALIAQAFDQHGLALGSHSLLAPEIALAGDSPVIDLRAGAVTVPRATVRNLRQVVGAPRRGAVNIRLVELGATAVARVAMRDEVALDSVDRRLRGCVASATKVALVGESGGSAALLFAPPGPAVNKEVLDFVHSLVNSNQVAFKSPGRRGAVAETPSATATHAVRSRGGKQELRRIRYACRFAAV